MKIKAILFDFDGTLSDLVPRWIQPVVEAIKQIRPDLTNDFIRNAFTEHSKKIIQASTGFSPFLAIRIIWVIGKVVGLNFLQRIKLLHLLKDKKEDFKKITPFPDTVFTIRSLSQMGYKLGLISTASRETLKEAITIIPDLTWFSLIITRDDVLQTKPDPEPFEKAMREMNLKNSECIYVGDLPVDVEGAKNAKIKSVLVLRQWGDSILEQFPEIKPDLIINELGDLINLAHVGFKCFI